MKKIFLILSIFISAITFAQSPPLQKPVTYGYEFQRLLVDFLMGIPNDTLTPPTILQPYHWIAAKGDSIYKWSPTSLYWILIQGSGGGGGGSVNSVTGTANRIVITGTATDPVINISTSYVGQSTITTLGTITTGVWNGTAIANANLANSTISGVSLGSNLSSLTIGTNLQGTVSTYNGSAAVTLSLQNAAADGSTKGAAGFAAADFDASSGVISIDYANGQAASGSTKGFLTSADWTTFNNKGSGTITSVSFTGGLISVGSPTSTPSFTVAGTSGGIPYFSSTSTWASSGLLAANSLMIGGGAGASPSTTTTGTGVITALGVNTGSSGAFVVNGGALGTPSSGTLTNATGLPEGGLSMTDITTNNTSTTQHGFFPKLTSNTVYYVDNTGALAALALGAANTVLTSNGATSAPTFSSVSAGSVTWNGITDPTGTLTLAWDDAELNSFANGSNTETWWTTTHNSLTTGIAYLNSSSSLTSGIIDDIAITGTAQLTNSRGLRILRSGANGSTAQTIIAAEFSVTNTNGTSGTNTALQLTASGATTANNAINITAGSIQAISGSASQRSMDMGNIGIFNNNSADLGVYAGTIARAWMGQSGFAVRDGNTAVFDMGNSGLGGTNSWRLTGGTVGTMKVATTGATAAVGVEVSGGEGANAFLNLYKDEGDDNDDKWSLTSSVSANALIFANNATEGFRFSTVAGTWSVRNVEKQGADVASAVGAIALGTDGNAFEITGTSAITLISNVNFQNGAVVTLIFTSTASLTDGTANSGTDIGMELAGNTNFTGSAGATISLRLLEVGGTQRWYEIARSVQ